MDTVYTHVLQFLTSLAREISLEMQFDELQQPPLPLATVMNFLVLCLGMLCVFFF